MQLEDQRKEIGSILENLNLVNYAYRLPPERIAKFPPERRDGSKLLVFRGGEIEQDYFINLDRYIESGSTLVFNNSRVIQARLEFYKDSGARIEVFCLEPYDPPDIEMAFQCRESVLWRCLIGNRKKWKAGDLSKQGKVRGHQFTLKASLREDTSGGAIVKFNWDGSGITFAEVLESAGVTPIPPYLNRKAKPIDQIRYQTIYSKENGSVAAPTAGLHFSNDVLSNLEKKKVVMAEVTLHVGIGTFRPIQSDSLKNHRMHTEHFFITRNILDKLLERNTPVVAIGTTSLRTLESIYWLAQKIFQRQDLGEGELKVDQWDGITGKPFLTVHNAFEQVLDYMDLQRTDRLHCKTQLMIVPGYEVRTIEGMLTNFHMPRSSLLLLVAAFIGAGWKKVYRYALEHDFRLLSYGDSSLLFRT